MSTILITGATGEIGRCLVRYYLKNSYKVIAVARSSEKIEHLKKLDEKGMLKCRVVNYMDKDSYDSISSDLKSEVVTKIVLSPPKIAPVNDCLPEEKIWEKQFKSVFIMPLEFLKFVIKFLPPQSRTKIVLLSGVSSKQIMQKYAISSPIRAAWVAEIKALAHAFGKNNIHINALSLGGVMTDSFRTKLENQAKSENKTPEQLLREKVDNVPLKKYASLDNVVDAVDSLLGSFSDHMTGNNILLDGGYVKSF